MKNRFPFITRFFELFCILMLLHGCQSQNKPITPSSEFSSYINAYTGGVISARSTIRVELTNPVNGADINEEIKDKLFEFQPGIKGKAYWLDNQTIEFQPEADQLKPGTLYNATFNLHKILPVEANYKQFKFSFQVTSLNYELEVKSVDVNADNHEQVSVTGNIRFSDDIDPEQVGKMINVKGGSGKSSVTVGASEDGRNYTFTVSNIIREDGDKPLEINVNGRSIGIKKEVTEKVNIPAKNVFKVLDVNPLIGDRNGVQLIFSDPVSTGQDLKGLIQIEGASSLVFQRDNNKINAYFPEETLREFVVKVDANLQNIDYKPLGGSFTYTVSLDPLKPQVEIPFNGHILPDSEELLVPFRAVGLKAVDIKVIRIYESNVLNFLQTNSLSGSYELRRFGRLVYKNTLRLDGDPGQNLNTWHDYSVDLAQMFEKEPGAIYRILFTFKRDYSVYPCDGEDANTATAASEGMIQMGTGELSPEDEAEWDVTESYFYDYDDIDWYNYNWEDRDNPCKPTYYMENEHFASCNVMASNIGLIVKGNSENKLWITASDIITTNPIGNADIKVYNFQLQVIGSAKTDANGLAEIQPKGKPFIVVAEHNRQKTYLKVESGMELSTSRFETGGKTVLKGLKGFIYGERGVWRPGDTLYISFILEDKQNKIPDNHPVTLELYNARGQFYTKQVSTQGKNGFWTFAVETQDGDPTGRWNAYIKVGGTSFHKSLPIETVKPNRLKINLDLPSGLLDASNERVPIKINSSWLMGAPANNLKARVEMSLSRTGTRFKGFEKYTFNNPVTKFSFSDKVVYDGTLDSQGEATFNLNVPEAKNAPGMLQADFTCRVFEPGGDASIFLHSVQFSPFNSYVGVNMNQPRYGTLDTDTDHTIDIVTVSPEGKALNRKNLDVRIYKLNWSWWWESRNETLDSYVNNQHGTPVLEQTIDTKNGGKASVKFRVDYPEWGRYLVYVRDTESGHASGGMIYVDWPSWRGRSEKTDPSGLTMLSFSTDKTSYEVGEEATITIPAASGGLALVSYENGSEVIKREWVKTNEKEDTRHKFKVTEDMLPNFFIHISLLQPHAQTANDLPIRMYGIVPVSVSDKKTHLEPQITMPDLLRPEKTFEVRVKEKNNRPMTYTLAVVDDGLLDLTNFKTPDPWNEFYAREGLGIRTWDMYQSVIGAFGGRFSPLLSIGGDEALKVKNQKNNRFKPVVKFFGPYTLKKGENKHQITLPMYVGSVRVMVVAGQDGAYGNAEKTVPVRNPLMVLSTLPRVVSVDEEISLPVNVFAMEDQIKNVTVSVETTGLLELTEGKTRNITFKEVGDQLVYMKLKAGGNIGTETIKITVNGHGQKATETIELMVRNPNPPIVKLEQKLLTPGESHAYDYEIGYPNPENWIKLETARIPVIDFNSRLDYLHNYGHYCTEQVTSAAFPILYLSQFKTLNPKEEIVVKENMANAIKQLYRRQASNGGFYYWPGDTQVNEWVTTYAGNFMIEARNKGYEVNEAVVNRWINHQKTAANNWNPGSGHDRSRYSYYQNDLHQAYRLYTLALAGAPELGAMNRMKEMKDISVQGRWRLAAAYAIAGRKKAAEEIIFNLQTTIEPYTSNNATYGSVERDEAMILETLLFLENYEEAYRLAERMAKKLSGNRYYSTQSTAFALSAFGKFAEKNTQGMLKFSASLNGQTAQQVDTEKNVYLMDLPTEVMKGTYTVTNHSDGNIYTAFTSKTIPLVDTEPAQSNKMRLEVTYTDLNNNPIDVSTLKQGTDFLAHVKVSNISINERYTDLALTHIMPSGWEIFNERLFGSGPSKRNFNYQDIRDDRVLTYFDLSSGKYKSFTVRLQAAYLGIFTLPAVSCEAMYDVTINARTTAGKVTVIP